MANTAYGLTKVFPKVSGLTGVSNVGDEDAVTLTAGVPGYMYHSDAATAASSEDVEIMAGNTPQNMWTLAAITCTAAGAAVDAAEATLTFAGGPEPSVQTATVTAAIDAGADIVVTYDTTKDEFATAVASAVQALVDAEADLTATVDGLVVTVAPATGDYVTKLEVAIA